jgi:hypothetical protein
MACTSKMYNSIVQLAASPVKECRAAGAAVVGGVAARLNERPLSQRPRL